MKDGEKELGKELAVQRERTNAMKAEHETGLVGIRADIAQYTAEGFKREARFVEECAKRDADQAKRDAEWEEKCAERDARFAENRAKWEARQADESARMIRTIYGVVLGGIGLAIFILGILIRLPS